MASPSLSGLDRGITYISWAQHCSRSDCTAAELGGVSHMVYWGWLGSTPATVWLKYIGQAIKTWVILLREKPRAVFVMSPPVIAGLVVFPYCAVRRIPFVVDAHTGAFLNPRWRRFQRLQRWLCRRAATTIVTNRYLEDDLTKHGADATILPDVPVRYPATETTLVKRGFTVAVICSFVYDEPIEVVLDAARLLPDVHFLMTGDYTKAGVSTLQLPANLSLTGFLDDAKYGQLLRDADVVVALTTAPHTMLRAAYEAIYQGTPVIISESPLLRDEFSEGAIIVDNAAEPIAAAVREMQRLHRDYCHGARRLRDRKYQRWARNKQLLITKLEKRARNNPPLNG